MEPETDIRKFKGYGDDGKPYGLIAERAVIYRLGAIPAAFPWRFRLEDGRLVLRDESRHGSYYINPQAENIRLTSTDPNQPDY